ncbi:protein RESTRICTED TEV MOVEMENT 2 isoform X1 [Vigna radiata var. radiata]|uniref:Protein RESTRICTED TEV MOVEMENT 2 isoform X1 n=1 Tax=Vigna radiata var. radiata TaxID=3916 RepID=A0A1S3VZS1_VIGRR|nr:protein RESTRICTED TEV MOVEMENT 2 isoform X1 [Vigna radiata var. radiata]
MAFRQRTPTFRPNLSIRRVYETFQPRSEIKDLPEAYLLRLYLPGFQRDSVKVTYVASSRTVRATGERQIQGTRWYRFDQSYPIPDYCEPEALGAKFETPVLTLTMPKKATSQEKGVVDEPKPDKKLQDTTTTPQPTITIDDTRSSEPIKDQAVERVGPSGEPQMGEKELESKPRTATMQRDEKIQKGREEFEPRPTPTRTATMQRDEKIQKGQEIESKPTPTKMETDENPQKGQEDFEPKPTPTMLNRVETAEKHQKGEEEFEPKAASTMESITKTDAQPPKGQEEDEPKADITNVTRKPTVKEQLKENKTEETRDEDSEKTSYKDAEGTTDEDEDEDEEKERITKREVKEEPSKSRKSVKDKKQTDFGQKETETEKLLAKEAETSATEAHKEKEKQSNDISSLKKELKSEENAAEKVGSVSQVFTKFAEGALNEEEKKLAANIGAAVLVIAALGYYVSYRFAS